MSLFSRSRMTRFTLLPSFTMGAIHGGGRITCLSTGHSTGRFVSVDFNILLYVKTGSIRTDSFGYPRELGWALRAVTWVNHSTAPRANRRGAHRRGATSTQRESAIESSRGRVAVSPGQRTHRGSCKASAHSWPLSSTASSRSGKLHRNVCIRVLYACACSTTICNHKDFHEATNHLNHRHSCFLYRHRPGQRFAARHTP